MTILLSSPHLSSDLPSEDKVGGSGGLHDPSIRRLRQGDWTSGPD